MNNQPVINIQVSDDRMQATLRDWSPFDRNLEPVSVEEVYRAIAQKGIIFGICKDDISRAIGSAHETGSMIKELVLAQACSTEVNIPGYGRMLSRSAMQAAKDQLRRLGLGLKNAVPFLGDEKICYFSKGEVVMTMVLPAECNIFGKKCSQLNPQSIFAAGENVDKDDCVPGRLTAGCNGYLHVNDRGEIDIFPLRLVSKDRMIMSVKLARVAHGQDRLDRDLDALLTGVGQGAPGRSELYFRLGDAKADTLELARGREPIAPKGSRVEYFIPRDKVQNRRADQEEAVDYRDHARFHMVVEGQVLAEKKLPVPGRDGLGVDGLPIPGGFSPPRDKPVLLGENVIQRKKDEATVEFVSKISGVMDMEEEALAVHEKLVIHGDTGIRTGHLHFNGDVIIDGNVTACTAINCGGSLVVGKNIENKARIECRGFMRVEGGVYGIDTYIRVGQNMEVGYVHDATLEVNGDLSIRKYAYNSRIFASGKTVVVGKGLGASDAKAVIGGILNSKSSLDLHSAGSHTNRTTIVAGMDMRVWSRILTALEACHDLEGQVRSLRQESTTGGGEAQEQLALCLQKLDALNQHILDMREKLFSLNLDHESIDIRREIIPDVRLQIGEIREQVLEPRSGKTSWSIHDNGLSTGQAG